MQVRQSSEQYTKVIPHDVSGYSTLKWVCTHMEMLGCPIELLSFEDAVSIWACRFGEDAPARSRFVYLLTSLYGRTRAHTTRGSHLNTAAHPSSKRLGSAGHLHKRAGGWDDEEYTYLHGPLPLAQDNHEDEDEAMHAPNRSTAVCLNKNKNKNECELPNREV